MKTFLTIALALSSLTAFASWNEVECTGTYKNKEILVEVEQPFPSGSDFRRAQISVTEDGNTKVERTTVSLRRPTNYTTVRYWGAGLDLEVDTWPDRAPRWGRDYRGVVRSSIIDNTYIRGLNCNFPNAF